MADVDGSWRDEYGRAREEGRGRTRIKESTNERALHPCPCARTSAGSQPRHRSLPRIGCRCRCRCPRLVSRPRLRPGVFQPN